MYEKEFNSATSCRVTVISTVEGGFFLMAACMWLQLSAHHSTYCFVGSGQLRWSRRKVTKYWKNKTALDDTWQFPTIVR